MASAHYTIRCKNWVRLPLLSGPLSILIWSRLVPACAAASIAAHVASSVSTMKSRIFAELPKVSIPTFFLHDPARDIFFPACHIVIEGAVGVFAEGGTMGCRSGTLKTYENQCVDIDNDGAHDDCTRKKPW